MPSLEQPCLLLPGGCERSTVYVCVPVDPALSTHSSVLETLMEYDGLVDLPAGVSFGDFEEWSTSVVEDASTLALDDLSNAIQVGEKLGAHNTAQLAEAFAARVKKTCWNRADEQAAVLQAWLPLSRDAQQLVLRTAGRMSAEEVFSWPLAMQQALADKWVSRGGRGRHCGFTIASGHTPSSVISFLSLLARTDPALPGLTSLSLECAIPNAEAASRLCDALLHHPALEVLNLRRLSWAPIYDSNQSPPAATVLRTLPQLTAITSLTLFTPAPASSPPSAKATEAVEEVMHAMAAAVSALPHLKHFHLHHTPSDPQHTAPARSGASPPKRRRLAVCMGPPVAATHQLSLAPVVAALAAAPALTDLTLPAAAIMTTSSSCPTTPPTGCCDVGPFSALQTLNLHSTHSTPAPTAFAAGQDLQAAATSCMPLLGSTPHPVLTNIRLDCPDAIRDIDGLTIRQIFGSVYRHPSLQGLRIQLGPAVTGATKPGLVLQAYAGESPTTFFAKVTLTARVPRAVQQALLGGLSSLRSGRTCAPIHACEIQLGSEISDELLEAVSSADEPLLRALTSLSHLRTLDFVAYEPPPNRAARLRPFCMDILSVPLRSFSALTSLDIHVPCRHEIPLSAAAGHLAGAPHLQYLCFCSFVHSDVQEFEACFAPLTAVTHLVIGCRPVTAEVVRAFARVVAGMPGLAYGSLKSCDGSETNPAAAVEGFASVDWFQGLLDLPSTGCYEFECCNGEVSDGEVEAVRQQLTARGAEVGEALEYVDFCLEADGDSRGEIEDRSIEPGAREQASQA